MKFSCVGLIKVEHPAGTTHILHSYLYSCNGNSWKFVVGQSNGSFNVCNYCVTSESTCFSCRWVCVCVCVRRWHRIYWSRNSGEALHLVSDHTHTPGCYDFLPLLGRVPMASTHPLDIDARCHLSTHSVICCWDFMWRGGLECLCVQNEVERTQCVQVEDKLLLLCPQFTV